MTDLATFIRDNQKERQRLVAFIRSLEEEDFNFELPNGWTVTMALGHLAFWDLRQLTMLRRWINEKVQPGPLDAEAINEPVSLLAEAISPESIVNLVLEAAEAIDQQVEKLTPAQVEELFKMGLERNIHRALHRRNHLDKIEQALK